MILWTRDCGGTGRHDGLKIHCLIGMRVRISPIPFNINNMETKMDKNSNPLDTLIDFALKAGVDKFWVYNARDELKKITGT